jgi:hypothetical protein
MMQSQWSGLAARTFDPTPLAVPGVDTATLTLNGAPRVATGIVAAPVLGTGDGISRPWWQQPANDPSWQNPFGGGSLPGANGAILGFVQGLIGMIQQLLSSLFSGNGSTEGSPGVDNDRQQRFQDVDISSTGDPHLAMTGTRRTPEGQQAVDQHYDSMSSHDDLLDTRDIAGGYRVSTTVTQPGGNGVTYNQSASVHADYGQETITLNKDGSFAISDHGAAVALTKGQSVGLSGGEIVTENQDGSLTVNDANARGGSISTTLHATGNGVDVTTHAHQIALGGDVVRHSAGG